MKDLTELNVPRVAESENSGSADDTVSRKSESSYAKSGSNNMSFTTENLDFVSNTTPAAK
jgi:hypothetical protein